MIIFLRIYHKLQEIQYRRAISFLMNSGYKDAAKNAEIQLHALAKENKEKILALRETRIPKKFA